MRCSAKPAARTLAPITSKLTVRQSRLVRLENNVFGLQRAEDGIAVARHWLVLHLRREHLLGRRGQMMLEAVLLLGLLEALGQIFIYFRRN